MYPGVQMDAAIQAELADGRLRVLHMTIALEPMRFAASWRSAPGETAAEVVAQMARVIALHGQT